MAEPNQGKAEAADSGNESEGSNSNEGQDGANPLTKNQLKKLKKKQHWEKIKAEKRAAERERLKARKRAARERGEETGPTRKSLKHNRMDKSSCKMRVAIDCDFDEYMTEKDIRMLVKQIQFSYSANRRAPDPLQLHVCSLGGKTRDRLENVGDYQGWDVHYREGSYLDVFDKSSVVYLSSESPNVLQTMEEDKVYVIGGLVDHNHHKGVCYERAEEKGVYHAQLPIGDYMDMKTRKVLTINHVFEILLRYTETNDWQEAFYSVIPQRKGAEFKSADELPNKSGDVDSQEKGDDSQEKGGNSQESADCLKEVGVSLQEDLSNEESDNQKDSDDSSAAPNLKSESTLTEAKGDNCADPVPEPT